MNRDPRSRRCAAGDSRRRARCGAAAALALALALVQAAGVGPLVPRAGAQAAPAGAPAWESTLLSRVSGRRAYRHVLELSQKIGPHLAGTPADRTSGDYIAGQLARDGYAVRWQPFQFPYFDVRVQALVVPAAPSLALHPRAMLYSGSTPPGGLTAPVVDAGLGRPEELARAGAAGKIALIERGGGLTFRQKADNAAGAGALAAVIYNNRPEGIPGTLGRPDPLPVVGLPGADGQQLLALVRAGAVIAHLDVQTVNEERTTWNIIGTKPGARDPRRALVVGAHRDTVGDAPGANDNTSGVAVALELAEVLRDVPLGETVRFVFFGAEEEGLFGSAYYVEHHGPEPITGMVDLDMEGVGARLLVANDRGSDALVQAAARLASQLGIAVSIAHHEGGSDHVSFERIGVPVVFLFRPDDPDFDTPRDTVDRVDPALLEASARLALAVVLDLAGPGR